MQGQRLVADSPLGRETLNTTNVYLKQRKVKGNFICSLSGPPNETDCLPVGIILTLFFVSLNTASGSSEET